MRLFRVVVPVVALGAALVAPASGQIPVRSRTQALATAPRLLVATPHVFTSSDSAAAVLVGVALRSGMERIVGTSYFVVPRAEMNEALTKFGYPPDAILNPLVARQLATSLQARYMVASTLSRMDGGRFQITSRWAGLNDDAGNVVTVVQQPGQKLDQLGNAVATALAPAVKATADAKACVDQRTTAPDKALAAAKKALVANPKSGLAHYCLAQLAEDKKAPAAEVIGHLREAASADSLSLKVLNALAVKYQAANDSANVVSIYQKMLLAEPTNQPLREAALKLFLAYGRPDAAKKVAEDGLALDPYNADLWDLKSNACVFAGDYDCAVNALEQVYANDSTKADSTFYTKISVIAAQKPDTVRLLKWARAGVNKFPKNVALLEQLVKAYGLTGQSDSVVTVTTRLLKADTTDVNAALSAAKLLVDNKRVKDALPFTDFAITHGDAAARENAAALLTNGAVPLLQPPQDFEGATLVLHKAVAAADPNGKVAPAANYFLGLALFFQVPKIDPVAEKQKSCELARQEQGLLTEAERALRLGQSIKPEVVSQNLGYIEKYKPRVASMIKAYCK